MKYLKCAVTLRYVEYEGTVEGSLRREGWSEEGGLGGRKKAKGEVMLHLLAALSVLYKVWQAIVRAKTKP